MQTRKTPQDSRASPLPSGPINISLSSACSPNPSSRPCCPTGDRQPNNLLFPASCRANSGPPCFVCCFFFFHIGYNWLIMLYFAFLLCLCFVFWLLFFYFFFSFLSYKEPTNINGNTLVKWNAPFCLNTQEVLPPLPQGCLDSQW